MNHRFMTRKVQKSFFVLHFEGCPINIFDVYIYFSPSLQYNIVSLPMFLLTGGLKYNLLLIVWCYGHVLTPVW